jgi:hypothetical protein
MSELVCMVCEHGPHRKAPCTQCGCTDWRNSIVQTARAVTTLSNLMIQELPIQTIFLKDILELLAEVYPEEVKRIDARREEYRRAAEEANAAQKASQQQGTPTDQAGQDAGSSSSDGSTDSALD